MTEPKNPQTPREWALCRCKLSCKVGKDAVGRSDGTAAMEATATMSALYNLLSAVESLAEAMEMNKCP